jgi:protein phosphatase
VSSSTDGKKRFKSRGSDHGGERTQRDDTVRGEPGAPIVIPIPEFALVTLIAPTGAGKSTFAREKFRSTEVLSSDFYRGLVSDDENSQEASNDAFEVLYAIARKRLARGKLVVIDATNLRAEDRKGFVSLAREFHCVPVALAFDIPESVCRERNALKPDRRDFPEHVIPAHKRLLRKSLMSLKKERFRHVFVLRSAEEMELAVIERRPTWTNRKTEHGPFDVIGDVHGCMPELRELLDRLGWRITDDPERGPVPSHPEGRKLVFLGDLVDRGPDSPSVLRLVINGVADDTAICVPGNHDAKLVKWLAGRNVRVQHGLGDTIAQFEDEPEEFRQQVLEFIDGLVSHFVLDDGNLVVAHGGMPAEMQGRASGKVRGFALFGETTGETDEFGLPVRYNWAADYRGDAHVVYGHTPVPEPVWLNRTINVDTGCVFGGKLTALRWPERELVSVPAHETYYEPVKPLHPVGSLIGDAARSSRLADDVLDLADVTGKRVIDTRLMNNITVKEENAVTALEVMSRFASNPKWLIYLPPTMSPCETSKREGMLEHPAEALDYYRSKAVGEVVCEEKHMGSRAVAVICRDVETARRRFGIAEDEAGIIYTRTGRRFFDRDRQLEAELVQRIQVAMTKSGLWDEFDTDWICLDSELMPWSAKAQQLLQDQYAAVGTASRHALSEATSVLDAATARLPDLVELRDHFATRQELAEKFTESYGRYCWPVTSIDDYRLAPFHILATEGRTYLDRDHVWHMDTLARMCGADAHLLVATPYKVINVFDEASKAEAIEWWESLVAAGGEGMVVKPRNFIARDGKERLLQPAVKCRGPEYLRIIYGAEYTLPENLERLRERGLNRKRSLALREFALGAESLERFVANEPLYKVHECVFGVLAMESEPTDPRL